MKTANILVIIFAFIALGIYKKYMKALLNDIFNRAHETFTAAEFAPIKQPTVHENKF